MKKSLAVACALGAFWATDASAQLIHLSSSDCYIDGIASVINNCNNNGSITLVGSVVPPTLPSLNSMDAIVDVVQCQPLSSWWRNDAAGCRSGYVVGSFDFTSGPFSCVDTWNGQAAGSLLITYPGPNPSVPSGFSERFEIYCSSATPVAVDQSSEYYMFKITVSKAGTVGGCAGCNVPTGLYLISVTLGQPAGALGGNPILTGDGERQSVAYNGWGFIGGYGAEQGVHNYGAQPFSGLCSPTPTRSPTWGQIKALYR